MGNYCRSDLLEERSEPMTCGRGCAVYEWHDVLTVWMSEEAESGAVKEGVRPLRLQTRSKLTSETPLSHRASSSIHLDSDRSQRPNTVRNRCDVGDVLRSGFSYIRLTETVSAQRSQAQRGSTALCFLLVMLRSPAVVVIFTFVLVSRMYPEVPRRSCSMIRYRLTPV